MKQKFSIKTKFAFKPFTEEFFKNVINGLYWNEAAGGDIPLNLIKESTFFLPYLPHCVNEDLVKSEFPDPLKLNEYLNNYLNDLLCAFRKTHSTQYVLTSLIQTLEIGLDNSGLVGTILMDLSKAYDCLPCDLLIAKVEAYGLDKPSLNLGNGYLRLRKKMKKLALRIMTGLMLLPQGFILGPLLFSNFINDIFLFIKKYHTHANLLTITYCSLVKIISH